MDLSSSTRNAAAILVLGTNDDGSPNSRFVTAMCLVFARELCERRDRTSLCWSVGDTVSLGYSEIWNGQWETVQAALATLVPLAALATSTWSMVVQVLRRFYKLVASCVVGLVRTIVGDGTAGSRNAPSVLSVVR